MVLLRAWLFVALFALFELYGEQGRMTLAAQEREQFEQSTPMAMLLLRRYLALGKEQTRSELKELMKDDPQSEILSGDGGKDSPLIVSWRGQIYAAFFVNHPMPESEFFTSLQKAGNKDVLAKIVDRHTAHLVVTMLNKPEHFGHGIDYSMHLMAFTHRLAQLGHTEGIFWSPSEKLVTVRELEEALSQALTASEAFGSGDNGAAQSLPLGFWVDIRLFSDQDKIAARTQGLEVFTGYEAEVDLMSWPAQDVYQRLASTVTYLFMNGPILQDGQTLGQDGSEQFKLSFQPHATTGKPTLMLKLAQDKLN